MECDPGLGNASRASNLKKKILNVVFSPDSPWYFRLIFNPVCARVYTARVAGTFCSHVVQRNDITFIFGVWVWAVSSLP